ncbi:MAG: ABC transporter ATP-binding protein, partial [Candidatus Rokuibacteriota bacterium]
MAIEVADGELLAVLGPSGCGKTTLLRLIAGFERVSAGSIVLDGQPVSTTHRHVPPEQRRVGIVFQSYALWPHMSVAENVGYPLRVARVPREECRRRVGLALETVGLAGFGDRRPADLSGGERQRVALARCLVMKPSLVLLDEPLANLDVHLRASMQKEFADFHRRTGTTMVYVTHDQVEAMALADRIAVMDRGRVVQVAAPTALYRQPGSAMVAGFLGRGVVVDAEVLSPARNGRCDGRVFGQIVRLRCAGDQRPSKSAKVCLRLEDLTTVVAGDTSVRATVHRITYQGGSFAVEVSPTGRPETMLTVVVPEPLTVGVGATMS